MLSFAGALLAFVPNAGATLQLQLSSGGTTINLTDCTLGSAAACILAGFTDTNGAAGQITYIGGIGNWNLNVTTGTVGTNPIIDLNSVDTVTGSGTGANTLTLQFSETGLSGPAPKGFLSTIGGTLAAGTTLQYQAFVDTSNTIFGTGINVGGVQNFGPGGGFSGSVTGGSFTSTGAFSATEQVILSGNGPSTGATSSFDAALDAVPEPAAVLLLGGALLFSAGAIRRKLTGGRN